MIWAPNTIPRYMQGRPVNEPHSQSEQGKSIPGMPESQTTIICSLSSWPLKNDNMFRGRLLHPFL